MLRHLLDTADGSGARLLGGDQILLLAGVGATLQVPSELRLTLLYYMPKPYINLVCVSE